MIAAATGMTAIFLYLLACASINRRLNQKQAPNRQWVLTLGLLALPLHGFSLTTQIYHNHSLDLGLLHILSLVGWLIAALNIGINSYRPLLGLSLISFPIAALGLLLSLVINMPSHPITNLPKGAESHIILSLLAYSVLFIAALQAILLALQNRELKHRAKHRHWLLALPPLQTMETLLFDIIAVGFVLLSLAIGTGFLTLDNMFAQHVVHKTILSILAWLIFATLLAGHHWQGWRGQTAIRFTLTGFALLLLGFYGSKLVLEVILQKV